jgi:hypothetical protein
VVLDDDRVMHWGVQRQRVGLQRGPPLFERSVRLALVVQQVVQHSFDLRDVWTVRVTGPTQFHQVVPKMIFFSLLMIFCMEDGLTNMSYVASLEKGLVISSWKDQELGR